MTLMGKTPDGDEIWVCPECGREMLINWHPKFDKLILAVGNPHVSHIGFKSPNVQIDGSVMS